MRIYRRSRVELTVLDVDLTCGGSIGISREVMADHDIAQDEQVHVLNTNNGERFVTYARPEVFFIEDCKKDGCVLYGAAARLGVVGDKVIVITYEVK